MVNIEGIDVGSFASRVKTNVIVASHFVATIRGHANDNGSNVQEIVGTILGENENLNTLCFERQALGRRR